MIRKNSRCNWIEEGDPSSKFLHAYLKARYRLNNILVLRQGDLLIEDIKGIKECVFHHFISIFQESKFSRPRLEVVYFNHLNLEDKAMLGASFIIPDIKDVI